MSDTQEPVPEIAPTPNGPYRVTNLKTLDEIVHSILDVMYARAPYTTMSRAVHIHPTISELIPTMLRGLRPLD
jgi:hypothetical protein